MFLGYQCAKVFEALLIFQISFLLHALNFRRSANIQLANFKIDLDFLGNQTEYRKSLTTFCSDVLIDSVHFCEIYLKLIFVLRLLMKLKNDHRIEFSNLSNYKKEA